MDDNKKTLIWSEGERALSDDEKIENWKIFLTQFEERFENRLFAFEPALLIDYSLKKYHPDTNGKELRQLWKKIEALPNPKRIECGYLTYPFLCSPEFIQQFCIQIQPQLEETLQTPNLYTFGFDLRMFEGNCLFSTDKIFYFQEMENGVCYSYFQFSIRTPFSRYLTTLTHIPNRNYIVWARYYCPSDPQRLIRLDEEGITEKDIRFEIYDKVPASFPKEEELPTFVFERIRREEKLFHLDKPIPPNTYWFDPDLHHYLERTYHPNLWITEFQEIKDCVQKEIIKIARKAARKAARKDKPAPKRKKIPVSTPDNLFYYPDLTLTLHFASDVSETTVEELEAIVEDVSNDLLKSEMREGFEIWAAKKSGDRVCEVTVDFGNTKKYGINELIRALEKSGMDIESISIE